LLDYRKHIIIKSNAAVSMPCRPHDISSTQAWTKASSFAIPLQQMESSLQDDQYQAALSCAGNVVLGSQLQMPQARSTVDTGLHEM